MKITKDWQELPNLCTLTIGPDEIMVTASDAVPSGDKGKIYHNIEKPLYSNTKLWVKLPKYSKKSLLRLG